MEILKSLTMRLEQIQPDLLDLFAQTVAQKRLGHAYLFEGARGTGKKDLSKWLAASIFCEHPDEGKPCMDCRSCRRIEAGDLPDLIEIEPDGQSIKVDQVRNLIAEFSKSAVEGSKKVYIVDEAEKMTVNAANSLLTFLEEPGAGTYLFLLTTVKESILPTIRSRCQIIHFQPLQRQVMMELLLSEGVKKVDAELLSAVTNDLTEAKELAEDESFHILKERTWRWFQLLTAKDPMSFPYVQISIMGHVKGKSQGLFCLDLLLYHYRDLLYLNFGDEKAVVQKNLLTDYQKINTSNLELNSVASQMEVILKGKQALQANVQLQGVLENIAVQNTWNESI